MPPPLTGPVVAAGKPLIETLGHGIMRNPDREFVYRADGFMPGAVREFYQLWYKVFGTKLRAHDRVMIGDRWDSEALTQALDRY